MVKTVSSALQTSHRIQTIFRKYFKMPKKFLKIVRNKNSQICEICQIINRGVCSTAPLNGIWAILTTQKFLNIHDFISHALSREILGSEALWPWLLAFGGLSALLQLVTLPFFPDSPSYLLIQKGNEEAFRKGRVPNLPPNSRDMVECQLW